MKQCGADLTRLQRAQPETDLRQLAGEITEQVQQVGGRLQVKAVMTHMNTGEDNFLIALAGKNSCLLQHLCRRHAAAAAPGMGDNAVGAEIIAAVLHPDKGAGRHEGYAVCHSRSLKP